MIGGVMVVCGSEGEDGGPDSISASGWMLNARLAPSVRLHTQHTGIIGPELSARIFSGTFPEIGPRWIYSSSIISSPHRRCCGFIYTLPVMMNIKSAIISHRLFKYICDFCENKWMSLLRFWFSFIWIENKALEQEALLLMLACLEF